MMKSLSIINDMGENVKLSLEEEATFDTAYLLLGHKNLRAVNKDAKTSKAYQQDGETHVNSFYKKKVITLTGWVIDTDGSDPNRIEELNANLHNVLTTKNRKSQLTLKAEYNEEGKSPRTMLGALVRVTNNIKIAQNCYTYQLEIQCAYPFWIDETKISEKIVGFIGGLEFPLEFPITFSERGPVGTINYKGNQPGPIKLEFRMEGTIPVQTPSVTNDLDEFLTINYTIDEGEKIIIDTNPIAPSVKHYDENGVETDIWKKLEWGSTRYLLTRGLNQFQFTAAAGSPVLFITYNNHYTYA